MLIAAAVVAFACLALLRGRPGRHADPLARARSKATTTSAQRRGATSTSPPTSSTTTAARNEPAAAVGTLDMTVARGVRQIGVQILYPALQAGEGASPSVKGAPYPLIVFSPGYDIAPTAYASMVESWAILGFVVAEADYPATAPGAAGGLNEADIVQHPADLEAVIDRILTVSQSPGGVLSGMVNSSRIGLAGHSDGGDVTDAVISNSCCRDPRIRAAAVLSGAELSSFGGSYGPPGIPLLVTQGDADEINPPECSEQIYDGAGQPRFYLDMHGASHLPPYTVGNGGTVYQQAVDRVTGLFWQAYLSGQTFAATELAAGAGLGPTTPLIDGAPVAQVGGCPGAP